jgi:hypothetical protein
VLVNLSRQGLFSSSSSLRTTPVLENAGGDREPGDDYAHLGTTTTTRGAEQNKQTVHTEDQRASMSDAVSSSSSANVFPCKLHTVLHDAERDGFEHTISWVADGVAFKVHDINAFVDRVMPIYFDQTKYESFRRQLNIYGFVRVKKRGETKNHISHPEFVKGDRSRCRLILRKLQGNGAHQQQQE